MLRKARQKLEVARWCLTNGYHNEAVSLGYFVMYEAVLAALYYFQVPISDEGWTMGQRWEHLTVRMAIVEYLGYPEDLRDKLAQAYEWRVTADYEEKEMTEAESTAVLQYAEEMLTRIQEEVKEE